MAPTVPPQHLRDPRQRHGHVEPPAHERLDPGQRPPLIRPPMSDRTFGQLLLKHGEQPVIQLRMEHRTTGTNPAMTASTAEPTER